MASCCSTAFAAEDLQSVMHRLGRQIQHHAGPMYDRHRHSVLSMIKCHFTSPHSPSHTAPYLCFHPSRGRPILVCFGPACLQLPLFAASNAQEGCGRTTGVCVLFRPPPSFHPHHVVQRATVVVSREGPLAPIGRSVRSSPPIRRSRASRPPPSIPGGWGRVRSLSPMEADEVEKGVKGWKWTSRHHTFDGPTKLCQRNQANPHRVKQNVMPRAGR